MAYLTGSLLACAGEGRALVVRGEPGVGKTVLLDYLAGRAAGCLVLRAVGVQSEMELAFAGLHQLCAPMLEHAESLPVPQREALRTAFGVSAGPVPDRFLVGLAVLGLLSEAAGERPLICVVDDTQWLDHASAQALGFAARRLAADPVGLVFAARVPGKDVAGLPELVVEGLAERDARALLESVLTGPLDPRVRDRIIADTNGNPLALLELPRGLTAAQLTGGFGLSSAVPLDGRIEEGFARQLEALPPQTRRLLQLAAADPSGASGADVAGGRAARDIGAGACGTGRGGGAGGVRRAGAVPASAGAVGGRPGRHRSRRQGGSCTAACWPRSPTPAAVFLIGGPGTGPSGRARARMRKSLPNLSSAQACPAPRWSRRSGRVPGAVRRADASIRPACRARSGRWPQRKPSSRRAHLTPRSSCWPWPRPGRRDQLQRARCDLLRAQVAFAS